MTLLDHTPRFDNDSVAALAKSVYGIRATVAPLPSERDQNFLLAAGSESFVLKIANALEAQSFLEAQNEAMKYLATRISFCPQLLPSLSGELMSRIESPEGTTHLVRLVSYLPGIPLGNVSRHSSGLLWDLGKKLGQLDCELTAFDHPAFHRDFHWDLVNGPRVIHEYGELVADSKLRELVYRSALDFARDTSPLLPKLRRSVIHGDANDYNVLVSDDDVDSAERVVAGLIDLGDMVWSYTVGELAVAVAYLVLDQSDPIATAREVVGGYAESYPLEQAEIEALWGLVLMRLCMSVCLAAYQQQQQPENGYLRVSQRAISESLPRLVEIDTRVAADAFRGVA